jgi:hypothetical protein
VQPLSSPITLYASRNKNPINGIESLEPISATSVPVKRGGVEGFKIVVSGEAVVLSGKKHTSMQWYRYKALLHIKKRCLVT